MKQCTKCKEHKLESEFWKRKSAKDGLCHWCKICKDAAVRKWQKENKELHLSITRKSYNKKREFYVNYKKGLECQKCGENHPACLVFHHRNPEEKKFSIGKGFADKGVEQIMDEIAKCDVLCANCHRKLHYDLKENINRTSKKK